MKLKGGFIGCTWCHGNGCMGCDEERRKAEDRSLQPMFTAQLDDPEDMRQLTDIFHHDKLRETFGPVGGGIREIKHKAAVARVLQLLRRARKDGT